jgi:hypothetical protein
MDDYKGGDVAHIQLNMQSVGAGAQNPTLVRVSE